jgi:hypothetical protein
MSPIGNGGGGAGVIVKPENAVYQMLSVNGDGSGAINQNVNGSVAPVLFYIQPPADEKFRLQRMTVHAIDGNWNDALQYGAIGALPNGIRIYVRDDSGIIKEYTKEFTIKRTHDWSLLAGVDSVNIGGSLADPFMVRWTFNRGATDIVLNGANNERFVVEIQDDLTGLNDQLSMVQGARKKIS